MKFTISTLQRRTDIAVIIAAIILFALKLPFRNRLLSWWDSAQFGLALERFSVVEHRPHPPGYPLYILLGKILTFLTSDPALSFILIGLVCSIIAAVLIFHLGKELSGRNSVGWLAAAIYAFAPITFYHELKVLTYVINAFFSALVAWESLRIIKGRESNPFRLALSLGIMGMVRPYESILMLPLAIWASYRLGAKKFLIAAFFYIAFQIIWIVPTVQLSGGFNKYFAEFISEAGKHERSIKSVASEPLSRLIDNWKAIYYYVRQSFPLWGFLAIVPILLSTIKSKRRELHFAFYFLWIFPALLLYSINNVNYAAIPIFISPPIALLIASGIDSISGWLEKSRLRIAQGAFRREQLNTIIAIFISIHLLIVFFSIDIRLLGESHRKYDPVGFNYHKLLAGDGYIYMLTNGVKDISNKFDGPDSVLILSDSNYRVLMYYLPEFQVLWTRYLSQKKSSVDGNTKLAFRRNDRYVRLPSFEYDGKKYWYYKIHENQKIAVFTDEMIGNIKENSRFFILPGVEASKAYALDLEGTWCIYFTHKEFGTISKNTAVSLGLEK